MNESNRRNTGPQGRDFALRFASAETIMRLVGAPRGVRTWHCPCHPDKNPSFSAKPGRELGTTVVACGAGCSQTELLDHFRKLGYRLGPLPPLRTQPLKVKRPVQVNLSVAFKALTRSEQAMLHMIDSGEAPSYRDFVEADVSRKAIGPGIRAMQALGLIGVRRSPRMKGCKRYGQNEYWPESGWRQKEPSGPSRKALNEALDRARTIARAARKGGEDITPEMVEKAESVGFGLRVPEVPPRGRNLGTDSYVGRRLASLSQDSDRPATFDEGEHRWSGARRTKPAEPPDRHRDDPGPTSEDAYGSGPSPSSHPPRASHSFTDAGWNPPCDGLDCGKAGECLRPKACRKSNREGN